jgi:predicted enzyme related to lactoylglutathione lyase
MAHPFVHVELNTTDVDASKKFYGELFGWGLNDQAMPAGTYTLIDVGEGTAGGIVKQMAPGAPSSWVPYVLVDDIEAATKKAQSLGAKLVVDVTDIGTGTFSILVDPAGAPLGLWKAGGRG